MKAALNENEAFASQAGSSGKTDWLDRVPLPLQAWLVPLGVLAVWQTIGSLGLISAHLLPAPSAIVAQFIELAVSGKLSEHLLISLWRAACGFLIGGLAGLILGLFAGLGRLAERVIDPSLQMLRTIPLLSLIPLFILWFGIGEFSKVLMIALGAFFPLYVNTFLGVRSVDRKLYEVSRIFAFTTREKLTKLIFPAAMPNLLLGVRLSLGVSWLVLVVAEMMGTSAGIGYMIQDARVYAQTDIVFVGIMIFAAVGKGSDAAIRLLESRILRWRDTFKG